MSYRLRRECFTRSVKPTSVLAEQEKERGSISAGKLADLVVLSRDILDDKERDKIADTKVVLTVVGGKAVWQGK